MYYRGERIEDLSINFKKMKYRQRHIFTFPAASKPTMRILISFLPNIRSQILEKWRPILNKK